MYKPESLRVMIPSDMKQKIEYLLELDDRTMNEFVLNALRLWFMGKELVNES